MNERIEDLARQCMSMRFFIDTASEDFDYKKFAELIVQECMSVCDERRAVYFGQRLASDVFIDKNMYAEGEAACEAIRYNIKKHFGVEQ